MRKYNILVFPCDTEIANEIINSLESHKYFSLIYASSEEDSYCHLRGATVYWLPYVGESNFETELNAVVKDKKIDFIIPAHDDVSYTLSHIENDIEAKVIGQSVKVNEIVRFKDRTYEYFKGKLPIASIYRNEDELEFPLFVKPKRGEGSKNSFSIETKGEWEIFKKKYKVDDFVWMELLSGEEYTVDCFSHNGRLLYAGARSREKTLKGISILSRLVHDDEMNETFREYAHIISNELNMHGVWFFQMKRDAFGKLKLLEVGPRVSGTMMLNRVRGVNFVELALFQALGHDVEIIYNDIDISLARALKPIYKCSVEYENLYIDFDDSLWIDESYINTDIMKLIFQAKNENKKVILITKNRKNDLVGVLHRYGIANIFDEIIHLNDNEEKVDFMEGKALLVDDSFSERKKAIENGFYAYANDSIEAIMKCFSPISY
jgi:hypothetical protein